MRELISPVEFADAAGPTMPSTHKKVVVRKLNRDTLNGFLSPAEFIVNGKVEVLNTSGNVVSIDLKDIKGILVNQTNGAFYLTVMFRENALTPNQKLQVPNEKAREKVERIVLPRRPPNTGQPFLFPDPVEVGAPEIPLNY